MACQLLYRLPGCKKRLPSDVNPILLQPCDYSPANPYGQILHLELPRPGWLDRKASTASDIGMPRKGDS